ncbi:MAG: hypothetical protein JSW11_14360 [Candidatus Heimdallarchaeota archaeon]|nr:MAG: hypothetical protein JSW11_14360 [Candidatus Heimdallarchaeota archaeon]
MGKINLLILGSLITIFFIPICPIINVGSFSSEQFHYPLGNDDSSQNNGLTVLFPNGGETLNGTVIIQWTLDIQYLGDNPWYSVFYSHDGGENWIQLAFSILEETYEWNTPLYKTFGVNNLVKVIAGSKDWETKEDISDGPFTIDNREEQEEESSTTTTINGNTDTEPDNLLVLLFSLFGSIFLLSGVGFIYLRLSPRFKGQKTFIELVQSSEAEFLKEIRHKVVIGLDNIRDAYLTELRDIPKLEPVSQPSMVEYFPTTFQNDLRSEMKGRTVLTLIEIAYQDPSETNPTKLAQSLNIPTPTLTREIKKLVDLQYIEAFVSAQVLQDARYRNFSITSKGFLFLSTLNEALQITINRLREKEL